MSEKIINGKMFDFDTGHLKESPCKTCDQRNRFPACLENCKILDHIQTILAGAICCSKGVPETEPYTLSLEL